MIRFDRLSMDEIKKLGENQNLASQEQTEMDAMHLMAFLPKCFRGLGYFDRYEVRFNPIPSQALGYAECIRGEQIHPKTLAVNTASILQ